MIGQNELLNKLREDEKKEYWTKLALTVILVPIILVAFYYIMLYVYRDEGHSGFYHNSFNPNL